MQSLIQVAIPVASTRAAYRRMPSVPLRWRIVKAAFALPLLFLFVPVRHLFRRFAKRQPVRIFTYHRLSDTCSDGMTISPDVFRHQLRYIARWHDIVAMQRALEILRTGEPRARPTAVLTFDDGYRSVRTHASPIMREVGVPGGCVYVCTDYVGTARRLPHDDGQSVATACDLMSWQEVSALATEGWTIGSHTVTHARLSAVSAPKAEYELSSSLKVLRSRFPTGSVTLAYPYGAETDITPELARRAREIGYDAILSNFGGENTLNTPLEHLCRIDVGANHETLMWKLAVHGIALRRAREWLTQRFLRWRRAA